MKKMLLCLTVMLTISLLSAQEKTDAMLFGDVKTIDGKQHLPYIQVWIKGTNLGTLTDASGHFKIANLPLGKQIIVAQGLGYITQEREVLMERGKAVTVYFELEEDAMNLEQVVITGTRSRHYVKDVPVRTEVITAKSIENKNAANLYQALEGIPGIRVENQCQACNFTMIRMQGLGAEHTQVLIDGQPMYSGLAGVYGLQQFSTVDVDKIEVIKGAGSALYGSGAVAGAINIISREPSHQPQTKVEIQIGSHGTQRYDLSSSLRNEKGNLGLNIFAQRYAEQAIDETGEGNTRDEVRRPDGVSDHVNSELTNLGFSLFVNDAFWDKDQLIIRGRSVFEQRQGGLMTDDYYTNPFTDGTENIITKRYEASVSYQKKLGLRSEINLNMAYVNHQRNATNDSYLNDYLVTHSDSVPDLRIMRPYLADEQTFTSTLSFSSALNTHRFVFGAQFFYDHIDESGMYVVVDESSSYYGASYRSMATKSASEFGLFLQDEWAIGRWMLVPGLRMDYHSSGESYTTDRRVSELPLFPETSFEATALNPRLAVRYKMNDQITLRANVGTGFRAPYGFSEDLHLCSGSPRVWKSSGLKPETSVSYNLSADYYARKIRLSANLFRTDLKNKIGFSDADAQVAALGYDYQWKNIDDAFVQGLELTAVYSPLSQLQLSLDFSLNEGRYKQEREDWAGTTYEKESRYISRFPSTAGNFMLEYTPGNWALVLNSNYQGSMYIDYYNTDIDPLLGDQSKIKKTEPFVLLNAKVSRRFGQFKLYAGVDNIFDYIQDERHLDDAAFLYAPVCGTAFYAGLSIDIRH
ncbi:MAG: TonB-dependent receptor [Bacteroidales bacterium]|nr:TonB-dependent receptor [Bacteroidales bacterium]